MPTTKSSDASDTSLSRDFFMRPHPKRTSRARLLSRPVSASACCCTSWRRTRRRIALLAGAAVVVGAAAVAIILWRHAITGHPPIDADDRAQVAAGQAIYAAQCARCHGAGLEGQPDWRERQANGRLPAPPHDATGHTWHHPDDVLFGITKLGMAPYATPEYQSDMPAFTGVLTDEEIAAVLAYIKSQWPHDIRVRHERVNEEAKRQ